MKELSNALVLSSKINMKEVYSHDETLVWLISFNDFDAFIKRNHLENFVKFKNGHYIATNWQSGNNKFDKVYFHELMYKVRQLKKID